MGDMLRSIEMTNCDVYIQPEIAFDCISKLGEMGCVQFINLNEDILPTHKRYTADICRCAELKRKLRYLETEMHKEGITPREVKTLPNAMHPTETLAIENVVDKWDSDIREMTENEFTLIKTYSELSEMIYILETMGPYLGNAEIRRGSMWGSGMVTSPGLEIGAETHLSIVTGVVRRNRSFPFEMMLWRISRGNIYYRQSNNDIIIRDPKTGHDVRKIGFLAICQGQQLSERMQKVCDGFRVNQYPCPTTYEERTEMLYTINSRMYDLEQVIKKSKYHRCKALKSCSRQWDHWMVQALKAKAVYYNLNQFRLDITKNCLIGQCWLPSRDMNKVQSILSDMSTEAGSNVPSFMVKRVSDDTPPTFHPTNKFTRGFQALINAYSVSSYRELNPGLYTIISFPFLFSLMFGDLGHGLIMFIFALWMVVNEKKFAAERHKNEIWGIFFGGRYVILLMGFFSMYSGFIYNDMFSKSFKLMRSFAVNTYKEEQIMASRYIDINLLRFTMPTYWYGLDPIWALSLNRIIFENSVKMKLSVIIGTIHMLFGILLSLVNFIYFKRYYMIFLKFIPEIIFMCCLFLWFVIMIYIKWFLYSPKIVDKERSSACAPSILITFINMILFRKSKDEEYCKPYFFKGQYTLQVALIIIAVVCVPILFFGIPTYKYRVNKKRRQQSMNKIDVTNFRRYQRRDTGEKKTEERLQTVMTKYHMNMGELLIERSIQTIEFVLSTVSHTASYLRLWALSLAHSQLSHMLWSMVFSKLGLQDNSYMGSVKVFFTFALWAAFTVSILIVMEGLSAFLHTLRLHWVEFMTKFYDGNGWPFKPFNLRSIFSRTEVKDDACTKFEAPTNKDTEYKYF